jgi:hypothetical protein
MTAHHVTPSVPGQEALAAPRRPTRRAAVAGIAVTVLIAAGGYGAAKSLGPASPREGANTISPSPQAMRELHDAVVHQYGPQAMAPTSRSIAPRDDVTRDCARPRSPSTGPGASSQRPALILHPNMEERS